MELFEINITTAKSAMLQYALRATELIEWFFSKKIRMFEFCGIEFTLNSTVVLLPVALVVSCGFDWFAVALFFGGVFSILLHEAGHAVGGSIVGNPVREIGLVGCGGYTIFARIPGATAGDALVCAFGPLANALAVLATVIAESCIFGLSPIKWLQILLLQFFGDCPSLHFMPDSFSIFNSFAIINMYMLLFNLVPAFPLDGGRCFRVLAERFMPPLTAATVTMFVARVLACAIAIRGVITDLILDRDIFDLCFMILVAIWIWYGSIAEVWRTEQALESSTKDPCLDANSIFQQKE